MERLETEIVTRLGYPEPYAVQARNPGSLRRVLPQRMDPPAKPTLLERIGASDARTGRSRAAPRAAAFLVRAQLDGCRRARHDRGRAASVRAAGARHHGAALADGRGGHPRETREVHAPGDRVRPFALPRHRREQGRRHRHSSRQRPAALFCRTGVQRTRDAAAGGVHPRVEAAQRAAQGLPPQPQSHGHRGGRVRRRGRC